MKIECGLCSHKCDDPEAELGELRSEVDRLRAVLVAIKEKATEYCSCTNADIELGAIVDAALGTTEVQPK